MEILTARTPDESLSLKQVQARLRIGPTKAYQLVASGQLPCVRIGRAIRVERSTLERWIRDREQSSVTTGAG